MKKSIVLLLLTWSIAPLSIIASYSPDIQEDYSYHLDDNLSEQAIKQDLQKLEKNIGRQFKDLTQAEQAEKKELEEAKAELARLEKKIALEEEIASLKQEIEKEDAQQKKIDQKRQAGLLLIKKEEKKKKKTFTWQKSIELTSPSYKELRDIRQAKLSPKGLMVAIISKRGCVLYDSVTGEELRTIGSGNEYFESADFTSDEKIITTGAHNASSSICVWDIFSNTCKRTIVFEKMIQKTVFNPHAQKILSILSDGSVKLIKLSHADSIKTLGTKDVYNANFSGDGNYSVTVDYDGNSIVWNENDEAIKTFSYAGMLRAIALDYHGKKIAAATDDYAIRVWDIKSGNPDKPDTLLGGYVWQKDSAGREFRKSLGHTEHIQALDFSSNGRQLVSAGYDGTTRLWNVKKGTGRILEKSETWIQSASFGAKGSTLIVADKEKVTLWKKKTLDKYLRKGRKENKRKTTSKEASLVANLKKPLNLLKKFEMLAINPATNAQDKKTIDFYMRELADRRKYFSDKKLTLIEEHLESITKKSPIR